MGRKWNNIKMKKAAQDKLRSQSYTKVLREILMAVKNAGNADPDANFALKIALQKAKVNNVPRDNIDDVESEDGYVTVKAPTDAYHGIYKKLDELKIKAEDSGLERLPLNTKEVTKESYDKIQKLIDVLESDDDVTKVYHNLEWNEAFAE